MDGDTSKKSPLEAFKAYAAQINSNYEKIFIAARGKFDLDALIPEVANDIEIARKTG